MWYAVSYQYFPATHRWSEQYCLLQRCESLSVAVYTCKSLREEAVRDGTLWATVHYAVKYVSW